MILPAGRPQAWLAAPWPLHALAGGRAAPGRLPGQALRLWRRRGGRLIWLAVVGVVNSVVSAYYYLRVAANMRQGEAGGRGPRRSARRCRWAWRWPPRPSCCWAFLLAPILDLVRVTVAGILGG